ncbi:MAG: purine-binding chemotaxis protein CheW, partial [Nitrospinae bacterium]|nr:purine-binding chemotaxis protein CheW [Nitrospinota bacterium]
VAKIPPSTVGAALESAKAHAKGDESVTFLVFSLANERYGVEITKVREIILMEPITPVPNTHGFVVGVMNLRDQVIPVFDLRKKLRVAGNAASEVRNIIVVEIEKSVTGLQVDDVNGIMALPAGRIEPPQLFEGAIETDYLYGLGNTDSGAVILLDAAVLCAPDEILF